MMKREDSQEETHEKYKEEILMKTNLVNKVINKTVENKNNPDNNYKMKMMTIVISEKE